MAVPECAHRLMRCRPSLVRGRAAQVNPGGFTTPARRPSVPHRTAGCGKSSLRPLMAGSSPSLPDGSNPSAAIVQSASDVQCSRLLKTTMEVVAEGVETPDCLAWLRQAGCDTVQGFLFARPMPAAAFVGFVNQWRNTTMNANEPSTSCCVCCKEIPLDAAFTPEGAEYVEHFCGLELSALRARASTATETSVKPDACDSPPSG
ncbi:DUF3330 domain-containing protein [Klebsiella pneumoniae]|nr:DUF3330 domain-containing protein [Klebsiella pneumoniae]